ncbi:hypothetical protein L0F63_000713 [Massospora cicadina]|nr:hypothetical protein L0F63_000713 [Massospora cicadina]
MIETIQSSGLIQDGKYFVDMVAKAFDAIKSNPSNASIETFLNLNFYKPGYELDKVNLVPYPALPSFINNLKDEPLKAFGKFIHDLWNTLIRRYNGKKMFKGCESSFLELKYDFVIPGGRFRELHYWDSFFIMEGLNLCHLESLSKSMLDNFLDIHDIQVDENPEKMLTRYFVNNSLGRPESYVEDHSTAEGLGTIEGNPDYQRFELFAELATGAESGWDYSLRWVPDAEERILPVDLNSIMYFNERMLAKFHRIVYDKFKPRSGRQCISRLHHHIQKVDSYERAAEARAQLMQKYMWDEADGSFYDYNLITNSKIKRFTLSNIWPFWADALTDTVRNNLTRHLKAFKDLEVNKTEFFLTPTTHIKSQLQWDQPNTWAPLEYISVEAMLRSHRSFEGKPGYAGELYAQALDPATRFTQTALYAWYSFGGDISETQRLTNVTTPGYLFEKYSAAGKGFIGGGGEHPVQIGFEWTNGVILYFINLFRDQLSLGLDISTCVTKITIDEGSASSYGMDY